MNTNTDLLTVTTKVNRNKITREVVLVEYLNVLEITGIEVKDTLILGAGLYLGTNCLQ